MQIGVLGLNHKSAALPLREKLAQACVHRFHPHHLHALDFVPLNTCNRSEIYFSAEDLPAAHIYLLSVLRSLLQEEFEHCIYSYFREDAFVHLARVTSGLDSAIVGETEIQGQVKQAYEMAAKAQLPSQLHFLFQKALRIGKTVRSQTDLARGVPTLESVLQQKIERHFIECRSLQILFVGYSKINYKIFQHLSKHGFERITFCNRCAKKLEGLQAKRLPWEELFRWQEFPVAIFGTKAPHFLVHEANACEQLVLDLSLPRNVHPQVGRAEGVRLLNIDQLNGEVEKRRKGKRALVQQIEEGMIVGAVKRQMEIFARKQQMAV